MKSVVSTTVLEGDSAFGSLGEVVSVPDPAISHTLLGDAEILAIRSGVKANASLLEESAVQFVGTATAGYDHLDTAFLDQRGIDWANAPGCNATSVADYWITALLTLAIRRDFSLTDKTVGIIGAGHVGTVVARKARALGMEVLLNDPPRADHEGDDAFVGLDTLLARSDIVTLHTPLSQNDESPYPTFQLADEAFFRRMKNGAIFINAARGPCCEEDALLAAMEAGRVRNCVLDVWGTEPAPRLDVLARVDIATPHIAGYSMDGKLEGTRMIYEAACHHFGRTPRWAPGGSWYRPIGPYRVDALEKPFERVLAEAAHRVYPIMDDDQQLREGMMGDEETRSGYFKGLRTHYPVRREFSGARIALKNDWGPLTETLNALDFRVENVSP